MPKVESYAQGTPSWVDLSTSDQSAAKDFYATLFGWQYEDNDAGNGMIYSMAQIGGSPAGAIAPQQPEEAQQGVPPHWNVYITVNDVDAVAERVPELGGNVLMAPMDVFDAGRMIVAQDSVGAVVMFWQPNQHIGAEVRDEHGALTWTLVMTTDKDATANFYSELLDIEVAKDAMSSPDGGTVHQTACQRRTRGEHHEHAAATSRYGRPVSLGGLLQSRRRADSLRHGRRRMVDRSSWDQQIWAPWERLATCRIRKARSSECSLRQPVSRTAKGSSMKIESYKQGTPCWTDLSTTDQDGAKEFYSKIFGWEYQDIPMGDDQVYSIAQVDGSDARSDLHATGGSGG